jgi:hypothetical protein
MLQNPEYVALWWRHVFGQGRPSGTVTRLPREVQTVKLIDRVQLGEIGYAQFERMAAFLDAERLGMADRVYAPETLRRRRREAKELGLSTADVDVDEPEFDASIDELLDPVRAAWRAA